MVVGQTFNKHIYKPFKTKTIMGLFNFKMHNANTNTTVANPTPAPKTDEPIVKEVDVMGLMGALSQNGQAKLSDHAKPVDAAPQTAPEPAPQKEEPKAEQKPTPKADKDTKKKAVLIEPKDANDALQHILALTKSGAITTTLSEDGKQRIFANAPEQNVLWTLRKCFRMLGGEHNGEKDDFKWTVPMEFIVDPTKAVPTKSAKQQEYEEKLASGEIKPRTANDNDNANDNHKGKGGKYTEDQVVKLMRMVNATLTEDACRVMLKAV